MILRGRRLWLIGASSGIGAALAPALAAEGAVLALSARREDELQRVANACPGPERPLVKPLDATDKAALDRTYAELVEAWGKVDIVFYNATTTARSDVDGFDTDGVLRQVDVTYLGLIRAVGAVLPDMLARGDGAIVGTGSLVGYAGFPRSAAYSSAKNAVNAFLQSLRIDLKERGISVVTVNPGFVRTPLTEHNAFRMPFLLSAEAAATTIVKGLLAGDEEVHFPKRLSWPAKLGTALPRPVYEYLARKFILRRTKGVVTPPSP
jgi:short-subunit dehydrogenase